MTYIFDGDVAKMVGVNGAVLFQNIAFWVSKNKANNQNLFEGEYWTYNSNQAFVELFPFMSTDQIRTALRKLEELDLIKSGVFNDKASDRTKWYTLGILGKSMWEKIPNAFGKNPEPIPYINTDINKEKEKESTNVLSKEKENDDFNRFWSAYPKKKSKADAEKAFKKVKVPVEVLLNAIEKQKKSADWIKNNGQYIPYPATWLNGKRWEDEADTGFMNGHVHFDGTDMSHYEKIEDRSEDLNEW